MPDFDVEGFVAKLERMGLKLTSVPLADGKVRINRWRMPNAGEHTQQIQDLWTSQIGDNQARMDVLAAHLARATPPVTVNHVGANRAGIGSGPAAAGQMAIAGPNRPDAPRIAAAPYKPAAVQTATSVPKPPLQPAAGPQRVLDPVVGIQKLPGIQALPGPQRFPGLQATPGPQRATGMQVAGGAAKPAVTPAVPGAPKPPGPPAAMPKPIGMQGFQPKPPGLQSAASPHRVIGAQVSPAVQKVAAAPVAIAPKANGLPTAAVLPKIAGLPSSGGLQPTK